MENFFKDDANIHSEDSIFMMEINNWPTSFEKFNPKLIQSLQKFLDMPDFIRDFHNMLHPLTKMIKHRVYKGKSPKLSNEKKAWNKILLKDAPNIVQKWHDLLHPIATEDNTIIENNNNDDSYVDSIEDDVEYHETIPDIVQRWHDLLHPAANNKKDNDKSNDHDAKDDNRDLKPILNPWFTRPNKLQNTDSKIQMNTDFENEHPAFVVDKTDGSLHAVKDKSTERFNPEPRDYKIHPNPWFTHNDVIEMNNKAFKDILKNDDNFKKGDYSKEDSDLEYDHNSNRLRDFRNNPNPWIIHEEDHDDVIDNDEENEDDKDNDLDDEINSNDSKDNSVENFEDEDFQSSEYSDEDILEEVMSNNINVEISIDKDTDRIMETIDDGTIKTGLMAKDMNDLQQKERDYIKSLKEEDLFFGDNHNAKKIEILKDIEEGQEHTNIKKENVDLEKPEDQVSVDISIDKDTNYVKETINDGTDKIEFEGDNMNDLEQKEHLYIEELQQEDELHENEHNDQKVSL